MSDFETKDSGARAEFDSGMVRDTDEGKTRWHYVMDGPMFKRWAEALTRGAVKYLDDELHARGEPNNWLKANSEGERQVFRQRAFRHFMQWYREEPDSEDHAAAVFFNINGAEYVKDRLASGSSAYGQLILSTFKSDAVYESLRDAFLADPALREMFL